MYIQSDIPTIVCDIGTETTKIGYASSESPSLYTSTRTPHNNYKSPLAYSQIENCDGYINHLTSTMSQFDRKLTQSKNYNGDVTYALVLPLANDARSDKEDIITHIFENTSCYNSLLFVNSRLLDLFSYGKVSGVVVSLGASIEVVGIIDGLEFARKSKNYGSTDMTKKVRHEFKEIDNIIDKRSYENKYFADYKEDELARTIKEDIAELKTSTSTATSMYTAYSTNLDVSNIRHKLGQDLVSEIPGMIKEVMDLCDTESRNVILNNIVLSGGCARIPFLHERLSYEMARIYPPSKVRVNYEKNMFSTFLGGSVIGSLGSVKSVFISVEDYSEFGTNVLDRKKCEWAQ